MGRRRKKTEPSLPLFDLPLFDESGDGTEKSTLASAEPPPSEAAPAVDPGPAKPRKAAEPSPRAPSPRLGDEREAALAEPTRGEPGLLFSEEDLVPVTPKRGQQHGESSSPLEDEEAEIDAPFQDRWLGGLADLTIHFATLGAMVLAVRLMGITVAMEDAPAFLVLGLVFSLLYTVVPLAFWGQTPGMAWVGHLARSDGNEPLTFGQTFLRWLGSIITVALLGLPVLLSLTGRSLCDRLSDSRTHQL